jgi:hypothetical protein
MPTTRGCVFAHPEIYSFPESSFFFPPFGARDLLTMGHAFRDFLDWVRGLVPGYLPRKPLSLWLTAKCLGYERAEAVAQSLRPLKKLLRKT